MDSEHTFAIRISIVIAVVLLIFTAVLFLGAYKYQDISIYGASIYNFFPFSAATIDGDGINLGEYNNNYKAVKRFYLKNDFSSLDINFDFDAADGDFFDMDIKRGVLSQMIDDAIAQRLLKKEYSTELSEEEIRLSFQEVLFETGSAENATKELERLYGWDLDDFLSKVAGPQMHMEELQKKVINDSDLEKNRDAKDQASKTLIKVKSGENFIELAKELSEGDSAPSGGDLGYFKRGVMVPEFEEIVFEMEEGEVSPVVKTRYGYHIIKVEKKRDTEIRARHILFRTQNFNSWFKEKKATMNIEVKIDGLKYDEESGDVIFEKEDFNNKRAEFLDIEIEGDNDETTDE